MILPYYFDIIKKSFGFRNTKKVNIKIDYNLENKSK